MNSPNRELYEHEKAAIQQALRRGDEQLAEFRRIKDIPELFWEYCVTHAAAVRCDIYKHRALASVRMPEIEKRIEAEINWTRNQILAGREFPVRESPLWK